MAASRMASLMLLGAAACGGSWAVTAFSTLGGRPAGQVAGLVRQPVRGPQVAAGTDAAPAAGSVAFGCALGMVAAAVGAARAGKRSSRSGGASGVARAAEKSLTGILTGTGPDSIQVGKDLCSFSTLVAAVQKAGLLDALGGPGPFTLFAPDDQAFAAFLAGAGLSADQLLANPDLARILQQHVVSGVILQKDFKNQSITTLAGTPLPMKKGVKGVSVGGAIIKKPDVLATNGVVHILSTVIPP